MATIQPLDEQKKKQLAPTAQPASLPSAVGAATMAASAPIQPGQPTMAAAARPAWVAQGAQLGAATNDQLDLARSGIGANRAPESRRVLDMVKRVDPKITEDINRRREFRMMTPQQRREHIGLEKAKREAFGVENAMNYGWDQIQAGSRDLSDATGMALDSYGSSDQFYTPDQMAYKRQGYREFDKQWGDILSNVDRSAWDNPNDAYDAAMSTDAAKKYGPFLQSYIFSKIREFASPKMRAQIDANQRNQSGFSQWLSRKTEQELIEMSEATGLQLTNDGTLKDAAPEYYKNRDSDLGAGALYNMYLDESPVMYMEENGKVIVDPAQKQRFQQAQAAVAADAETEAEKKKQQKISEALDLEAQQRSEISGVKHYVINGKVVPETELKALGAPKPEKPPVDQWKEYSGQQAAEMEAVDKLSSFDDMMQFADWDDDKMAAWVSAGKARMAELEATGTEADRAELAAILPNIETAQKLYADFKKYGGVEGIAQRRAETQKHLDAIRAKGKTPDDIKYEKEWDDVIARNPNQKLAEIVKNQRSRELLLLDESFSGKTKQDHINNMNYWKGGGGGGLAPGWEKREWAFNKYFDKYSDGKGNLRPEVIAEIEELRKQLEIQ